MMLFKKKEKKKRKIKRTKSISWQFALIFASLMIGTIAFFLLVNSTFLEKFYIRNKETALRNAYTIINNASDNSALNTEEFESELNMYSLKFNIDVIVIDVDSETVIYKGKDQEAMRIAIWDKLFLAGRNNENDQIVEQTEEYQLLTTVDRRSSTGYIEMWGFLSNGNIFLMRSALQSIQESARITNLFLMYTGAVALVIGIIFVLAVCKQVAKPILELAVISERMGELDFEAKYNGKQKNEIGLLGQNINKMSDTLETTISELKAANIALTQDIERKEQLEEMRSEFVANVSHELKTPIAIIQGYAEGLVEGISEDQEERDYYCSVICDEADKMNNMVKKLLTLNELEFGNDNVKMERFDIVTMIKNRISATELLAKQNDFNIIFSENEPIYVWGDEFKAEEVVTNYISNAINHCSGEKIIRINTERMDKKLHISVFNTGERVPEDSIGHLFEKFYKVDKARTRAYGGSGIGLSIVKAIQESIGQEYGVTNEDDGVTFWFEMDMA